MYAGLLTLYTMVSLKLGLLLNGVSESEPLLTAWAEAQTDAAPSARLCSIPMVPGRQGSQQHVHNTCTTGGHARAETEAVRG
jgi:hypothetical protein